MKRGRKILTGKVQQKILNFMKDHDGSIVTIQSVASKIEEPYQAVRSCIQRLVVIHGIPLLTTPTGVTNNASVINVHLFKKMMHGFIAGAKRKTKAMAQIIKGLSVEEILPATLEELKNYPPEIKETVMEMLFVQYQKQKKENVAQ